MFLEAVRRHEASQTVREQAQKSGMDLEALRTAEPLTYAAINAAPLLRTDARLVSQVGVIIGRLFPNHQLFNVPLSVPQTDTELRAFPAFTKAELSVLDDALGALVTEKPGAPFYRTVGDRSGERRELAWPLEPKVWSEGEGLVGPFPDQGEASAWGEAHIDPRSGYVYDTMSYAGGWFCDVFRGE